MPWQCWVGFPCMGGSEKAEAREAARRPGRFQTRRASFQSRSFLLPATPRAPSAHSGSKKGWLDPRAASTAETLWSLHSLQTERGLCLSRTPDDSTFPPRPPQAPDAYGLSGGRCIPPAAGEAQAARRAPQQVPHPPGRPHGTVVPPQGAAGVLPALAARQVPVGPVRGREGLRRAARHSPKPVPTALGFSFGQRVGLLLPSKPQRMGGL